MFRILLGPRLLTLKNSITTRAVTRKAPFAAIGIAFWILLYIGSCKGLAFIKGMEIIGDVLAEKLFAMIFFSLSGFLVLSNVVTALSSFYLSRDLPFLFSKPVPTSDILKLKSLESILNSSWMVIVFIPPVFIAYGQVYHASALYYLLLAATLVAFILIPAGIGAAIAHLLAGMFPAKRSRDVLLGLGLLLFIAAYAMIKTSIPKSGGGPGDLIGSLMRFNTDAPLLPDYWIAQCLFPLLRHRGTHLFYVGLLAVNAAFFLILSSFIGSLLYRRNMELIQPSSPGPAQWMPKTFLPGKIPAVLLKDMKVFSRDTGQWSQVFIIGALVFVYVYNFRSVPIEAMTGLTPFFREIMALVNMAMAGLVLSAVAARFLYTAVSLEGRTFWLIRTAPVDMRGFLLGKLLSGCIPLTILSGLLVLLTNAALGVRGPLMAVSLVTMLMLSVSISGLGTGLGAAYPKFKYENIASVSMSLAAMAFMLIAFCLVLLTLLLGSRAYYLCLLRPSSAIAAGSLAEIIVCVCLMLALNASAFFLPLRLGERYLGRNADF
jgi:ABC-2 type transport system permease protein